MTTRTIDWTKVSSKPLQEKQKLFNTLCHMQMDVRATLVCARKLPDVVNLYQPITLQESRRKTQEIEVPIVRADGRKWMMATLLYPFTLDSDCWKDKQEGLQTQLQRLLKAAQQHQVNGKPPQVLILFWRGLTDEVRSKLKQMGVRVEETPLDPIPLLEDA